MASDHQNQASEHKKLYSSELPNFYDLTRTSFIGELSVLSTVAGAACVITVSGIWTICRKLTCSKKLDDGLSKRRLLQLIKKASLAGCTETIIDEIKATELDVNEKVSSSGLTFFLCGCLSGDAGLVKHMLEMGADVSAETTGGDTALYLATYAVLHSDQPDTRCRVNQQNNRGYTPLHRAASRGNIKVIQFLLLEDADPYIANNAGVYPIDSAICAGHLEAARLLKLKFPSPHVWDVVDPHTPLHIKLGLQSPQRKPLLNAHRRPMLRNVFT